MTASRDLCIIIKLRSGKRLKRVTISKIFSKSLENFSRYSMISLMDEALKNRAKLAEWWARVESRPSFKGAQIFKDPVTFAFIIKKRFQQCTLL